MASLAEAPPVTEQTPEPIAINTFEKATTAYAAVYSVQGRGHPLVSADHGHMGELLVALEEADQTPHIFRGDNAQAIRASLQELVEDSASHAGRLYGAPAKAMLDGTLDTTVSIEAIGQPARTQAADRSKPSKTSVSSPTNDHKPARIAPASAEQLTGRFLRSRLTLQSFGELVTARQSVVARLGGSADTNKPSRSNLHAFQTIDATRAKAEPFKPTTYTFDGKDARTIRKALREAAERGQTIHDAQAAVMIKRTKQPESKARATNHRHLRFRLPHVELHPLRHA
ncbi:MAG: hypothetical protein AAB971_01595 [Patescibacteria group bacterium]